jgi:hypothetical protein
MRRLAPLIFVVALVVPTGCGSSGNPSSSTNAATGGEGALTKAQFVARADAICEATKAKQEPLREKLEEVARQARGEEQGSGGITDGTRRQLAQALGRIVAMSEASQSRIQALGIPKEDAAQLEAIFQQVESSFESSLAYGAALEQREDAKAQAVAEKANTETHETAVLARRYGFKVCGAQP